MLPCQLRQLCKRRWWCVGHSFWRGSPRINRIKDSTIWQLIANEERSRRGTRRNPTCKSSICIRQKLQFHRDSEDNVRESTWVASSIDWRRWSKIRRSHHIYSWTRASWEEIRGSWDRQLRWRSGLCWKIEWAWDIRAGGHWNGVSWSLWSASPWTYGAKGSNEERSGSKVRDRSQPSFHQAL